ncbi:MAG TPA: methionine ABC transporter ATP-binding protein [Candidatus Fimiplasma intestinipullorum]|uniref:Methionine ABC transporter ATP-binding protein n=1 Tax=Candidatus Fimiplasma intestinipullorum TaxID=2840825 RepID=A0A9D1L210_9FIRM|nr:methionine ABC transporter ATP-binding protein [Candidatus Fimiplasma intestinipullorum]
MIQLTDVSKIFKTPHGEVRACQEINLEIKQGEIFGIIGFSGAGKSTLVRCINLLERPTTGSVIVDGQDLTKQKASELRQSRKKIGMIFQHFNLMPSRTVAKNVAFPLKGSGLSKQEIKQKVASLLELVELSDKASAYPSQLSGGQKQRVAIARALANDPKVLLCDEATSALDPQTTQSILKLLKDLNQKLGLTIVLITHEMAVIKEICSRVAVMEEGHIKEIGDVVDIFAHPKAEITRNFIATTSNLTKIGDLLKENAKVVQLNPGEQLLMLTYSPHNTNEPLISAISRKFDIDANIIFGNVEVLQHQSLGSLVVKLSGEQSHIEEAITYIKDTGVQVEVLKTC